MPLAWWRPRCLAAGLGAAGFFFLSACADAPQPALASPFFELPDGGRLAYVTRPVADEASARYRAYVIPGSGCRGMAPVMAAYFRGLRQAEVVVLHKRHVDPALWPGPRDCGRAFISHDQLGTWAQEAQAFMTWHLRTHPLPAGAPVILVGISEGAELLPSLAQAVPQATQLVLIGSTGLDPLDALRLQAGRLGAPDFVARMLDQVRDPRVPDEQLLAGRSMAYWRSLANWPLSQPLLNQHRQIWIGFGEHDAQVPLAGLADFVAQAQDRNRLLCVAVVAGADHGLQTPSHDALQLLWGWVEASVLAGGAAPEGKAPCGPLRPNDLTPLPLR